MRSETGSAENESEEALLKQIAKSEEVSAWLSTSGRKVKFRPGMRSVLVAGSIQLAMEHHAAIVTLAKHRHHASLLALTRSIYEAYVWATWSLWIATDDQLTLLAEDRFSRGLESMVRDLDKVRSFDESMLKEMKPVIDKMNRFVHGGFEHLRYRIHKTGVRAQYPHGLIIEALRIADLFAIMALLDGPAIDQDIPLGDRLHAEARQMLGLATKADPAP
ncbi:MAG: DUF6988 family protein [Achromobacter pestifer]